MDERHKRLRKYPEHWWDAFRAALGSPATVTEAEAIADEATALWADRVQEANRDV